VKMAVNEDLRQRLEIKKAKEFAANPRWDDCVRLELPKAVFRGQVSFSRHLGKPLSQELWVDLTLRLRAFSIRIWHGSEEEGWNVFALDYPSGVDIFIDEHGNVSDISYEPDPQMWMPEINEHEASQI